MTEATMLRFEFRVLNADGEEIAVDWTTFRPSDIDQFGNCEPVDIHVGSALRFVKRNAVKRELEEVS